MHEIYEDPDRESFVQELVDWIDERHADDTKGEL